MANYEIDDDVPIPMSSKEHKVELAQSLYDEGGISKNEAAKKVWTLHDKSGFKSVEEDSAIQYIARRIV